MCFISKQKNMISFVAVFFVVLLSMSYGKYYYHGVIEKMEMEEVVPDVLQIGPRDLMEVTYGEVKAYIGNELTPSQTKTMPQVNWKKRPHAFHTISMTDPDSPSRDNPSNREFLHWLAVNVPGNQIDKGEILSEYIGPGPANGTSFHRYVFLVYKQPKKIKFDEPYLKNGSTNGRLNFSILKFAQKYNLSNPIAGNFFEAQWDHHIPPLY